MLSRQLYFLRNFNRDRSKLTLKCCHLRKRHLLLMLSDQSNNNSIIHLQQRRQYGCKGCDITASDWERPHSVANTITGLTNQVLMRQIWQQRQTSTSNARGWHRQHQRPPCKADRPSAGWRSGWLLFRRCLPGCGRGSDALLVAEGRCERTDGQMEAGSQLRSLATRPPHLATLTSLVRLALLDTVPREKKLISVLADRPSERETSERVRDRTSPHSGGSFINSSRK